MDPLAFLEVAVRHGIRSSTTLIILLLAERQPGVSMKILARRCRTSSTAITQAVDRLEEHDHVERRPVPGDRRGHGIHLTTAGRSLLETLRAAAAPEPTTTP